MASPNVYGYTPSVGLQSKDVDIEQEDLTITLSDSVTYANYTVRYHIKSDKEEGQLILIFDPAEPFTRFEVFLDGKAVNLIPIQNDSIPADTLIYGSNNRTDIYHQQFSLDINKGQHTIDVSYVGQPSEYLGNWVTEYTHTYNLKPAKSWKSFGKLNLIIDASSLKDHVSVNIQDSVYQIQGKTKTWQFDSVPQNLIEIRFLPKGDLSFMIYPEAIFIVVFVILFVLNLWWLIRWRQLHLSKKYTLPAILGSLIVPALSIAAYMCSYPLIDCLIGKYAASFHGYVFLVIFTYPFFAIFYFIVMWVIDHFYKRQLRNKKELL